MQIDTAGTYLLKYTAEDSCGNETVEEREVEVYSVSTVLYTDGTFIINERSIDRAANIALHGAVTNEYYPLDPNGSTNREKYIFSTSSTRPWDSKKTSVTSIEIGSPISPTHTAYWFNGFSNCSANDLTGLDTSKTISMAEMFNGCTALSQPDVSHFDTSKVTNMAWMFKACKAITSLDISNFDTSSAVDMSGMFESCEYLQTVNVSSFDTSKVENMTKMFYACIRLTSVDVSGFNTENVKTMGYMFCNCNILPAIDVSDFNTSNVENMEYMFEGCNVVASLDVSNFVTSKVTNMRSMFSFCRTLTSLDLSSFDTSLAATVREMFSGCKGLITIYASPDFAVASSADSYKMFNNMSKSLTGGAGTTWSSSNVSDATYAHIDGGTADPGYFTLKSA